MKKKALLKALVRAFPTITRTSTGVRAEPTEAEELAHFIGVVLGAYPSRTYAGFRKKIGTRRKASIADYERTLGHQFGLPRNHALSLHCSKPFF